MVRRSAGTLTAAAGEAVRTLLTLLKESAPPTVRLGAARAVLEIGIKVRELAELAAEMQELEERVNGIEGERGQPYGRVTPTVGGEADPDAIRRGSVGFAGDRGRNCEAGMTIRGRVAKVRAVLVGRARPDLAFMAVWMPVGSSSSAGRPPGLYQTGGVIDLVYEGEEPDPAVLARLRARTTPSALTIRLGPEVVDPPPELP